MKVNPLISVGIPTYNRPAGLERTLNLIINQTYSNIEIIVSNNCSPNAEVEIVALKYLALDPRIKYYSQEQNIGPLLNFKFVLTKASGEYFMWAADDDEWHSDFIARCLANIGRSSSVMSAITVLNRTSGISLQYPLPDLSEKYNKFQNTRNFLATITPSLIYGIHKRERIQFFLHDNAWDYYDCYFVLKQILNGGFVTIPDRLYTAGIDAKDYVPKPLNPKKGRLYEYSPFYYKSVLQILKCNDIRMGDRVSLIKLLTNQTISNFVSSEMTVRPKTAKFLQRFRSIFTGKNTQ